MPGKTKWTTWNIYFIAGVNPARVGGTFRPEVLNVQQPQGAATPRSGPGGERTDKRQQPARPSPSPSRCFPLESFPRDRSEGEEPASPACLTLQERRAGRPAGAGRERAGKLRTQRAAPAQAPYLGDAEQKEARGSPSLWRRRGRLPERLSPPEP